MIVFLRTKFLGRILFKSFLTVSILANPVMASGGAAASAIDEDVVRFAKHVREWRAEYVEIAGSKGYAALRQQMTTSIKSFGISVDDESSISQLMNALLLSRASLKAQVRELAAKFASDSGSVTSGSVTDEEGSPAKEEDARLLAKAARKIERFKSVGARTPAIASPDRGTAQFTKVLAEQERTLREEHAKHVEDLRVEFATQQEEYQRRIAESESRLAESARLLEELDHLRRDHAAFPAILETLKDEHTRELAAQLSSQEEVHARQLAEVRAQLTEEKEAAIAELAAAASRSGDDTRSAHETAMRDLEASYRRQLKDHEERLQRERTDVIDRLIADHAAKLAQTKAEHERELETLRQEQRQALKVQQEQIADLKAVVSEIEELRKAKRDLEVQLEELRAEGARALALALQEKDKEHTDRVREMQAAYDERASAMEGAFDAQKREQSERFERMQKRMIEEHEARLSKAESDHAAQLAAQQERLTKEKVVEVTCLMEKYRSDGDKSIEAHRREVEGLQAAHRQALAEVEERLNEDRSRALETIRTEHEAAVRALRDEHEQVIRAARMKAEESEGALRTAHTEEMARMKVTYDEQIEELTTSLRLAEKGKRDAAAQKARSDALDETLGRLSTQVASLEEQLRVMTDKAETAEKSYEEQCAQLTTLTSERDELLPFREEALASRTGLRERDEEIETLRATVARLEPQAARVAGLVREVEEERASAAAARKAFDDSAIERANGREYAAFIVRVRSSGLAAAESLDPKDVLRIALELRPTQEALRKARGELEEAQAAVAKLEREKTFLHGFKDAVLGALGLSAETDQDVLRHRVTSLQGEVAALEGRLAEAAVKSSEWTRMAQSALGIAVLADGDPVAQLVEAYRASQLRVGEHDAVMSRMREELARAEREKEEALATAADYAARLSRHVSPGSAGSEHRRRTSQAAEDIETPLLGESYAQRASGTRTSRADRYAAHRSPVAHGGAGAPKEAPRAAAKGADSDKESGCCC